MGNTQWFKTEYKGVRFRKHATRKHGVQFDRYFVVTYKLDGKTKTEGIGWASEGVKASDVFTDLSELKKNQKAGKSPRTFAEKRKMAFEAREAEAAKNITLDKYWPEYLEHAKRIKKSSSWEKEDSHYRLWLSPLLGNIPLQQIGMAQWDTLTETLSRAGKTQRTREYITGTLRRILKHAYDRHLINEPPPSGKRIGATGPGNSNRRHRVIRPDEAEAILNNLEIRDKHAWRITRFAFLTGCRASEAFNLRWQDTDLIRGILTFPETKNRDTRHIPLSEPLEKLFSELQQGKPGDIVFIKSNGTPYQQAPEAFRSAVKDLKLNEGHAVRNRISFHSIRHSVATQLAKRLNLRDLMDVMGWRTVQMAMRYVHGNEKAKTSALAGLAEGMKHRQDEKVIDIRDMRK